MLKFEKDEVRIIKYNVKLFHVMLRSKNDNRIY